MKLHRWCFMLCALCVAKIVIGHEEFDTRFYLALAALALFITGMLLHLAQDTYGKVAVAGLLFWKLAAFIPVGLFALFMVVTH